MATKKKTKKVLKKNSYYFSIKCSYLTDSELQMVAADAQVYGYPEIDWRYVKVFGDSSAAYAVYALLADYVKVDASFNPQHAKDFLDDFGEYMGEAELEEVTADLKAEKAKSNKVIDFSFMGSLHPDQMTQADQYALIEALANRDIDLSFLTGSPDYGTTSIATAIYTSLVAAGDAIHEDVAPSFYKEFKPYIMLTPEQSVTGESAYNGEPAYLEFRKVGELSDAENLKLESLIKIVGLNPDNVTSHSMYGKVNFATLIYGMLLEDGAYSAKSAEAFYNVNKAMIDMAALKPAKSAPKSWLFKDQPWYGANFHRMTYSGMKDSFVFGRTVNISPRGFYSLYIDELKDDPNYEGFITVDLFSLQEAETELFFLRELEKKSVNLGWTTDYLWRVTVEFMQAWRETSYKGKTPQALFDEIYGNGDAESLKQPDALDVLKSTIKPKKAKKNWHTYYNFLTYTDYANGVTDPYLQSGLVFESYAEYVNYALQQQQATFDEIAQAIMAEDDTGTGTPPTKPAEPAEGHFKNEIWYGADIKSMSSMEYEKFYKYLYNNFTQDMISPEETYTGYIFEVKADSTTAFPSFDAVRAEDERYLIGRFWADYAGDEESWTKFNTFLTYYRNFHGAGSKIQKYKSIISLMSGDAALIKAATAQLNKPKTHTLPPKKKKGVPDATYKTPGEFPKTISIIFEARYETIYALAQYRTMFRDKSRAGSGGVNVIGLTEHPQRVDFAHKSETAALIMPFAEVAANNNITRVNYDNPHMALAEGFRLLRRVHGGKNTDDAIINTMRNEGIISERARNDFADSIDNFYNNKQPSDIVDALRKFYEVRTYSIRSAEVAFADWYDRVLFPLLLARGFVSDQDRVQLSLHAHNLAKNFVKRVAEAIGKYKGEAEWVVNPDADEVVRLRVPPGSAVVPSGKSTGAEYIRNYTLNLTSAGLFVVNMEFDKYSTARDGAPVAEKIGTDMANLRTDEEIRPLVSAPSGVWANVWWPHVEDSHSSEFD